MEYFFLTIKVSNKESVKKMHPKRAHTNVANVYSLLISAHHTLRAHVPKSLCKLAGVVTNLQGLTAKRALHEKRVCRYFAEMGLDEEKTALGEEIVSEQVNPLSIYIFLVIFYVKNVLSDGKKRSC